MGIWKAMITTSTQLLDWRKTLIDVWNWFLRCIDEIQALSQVFYRCLHGRMLSSSSSSSFNYDILVLAWLPLKSNFGSARNMLDKFRI